jgi:hypothetical protein
VLCSGTFRTEAGRSAGLLYRRGGSGDENKLLRLWKPKNEPVVGDASDCSEDLVFCAVEVEELSGESFALVEL